MLPPPNRPRVLIVDDDADLADAVAIGLEAAGYSSTFVTSGAEAEARVRAGEYDALVTDLRIAGFDGMALLALSRSLRPDLPIIVMTAFSAIESAVESIRQGAYHYMTKPFRTSELALFLSRALEEATLRRETRSLRAAFARQFSMENVVARSPRMQEACSIAARVAATSVPVLLAGETGSGKGVLARAIHQHSERKNRPFVTVNCAALPEALLESELFGHLKGAFTGATGTRDGLFVEANGGTLFLDEIAEMSPTLQAKLLDVLERGAVRAVGADRERQIDTRIISATHRDLTSRVAAGNFREDLLYRLNVIVIDVPSLRHRLEDIPLLTAQLLASARERNPNASVSRMSAGLLQKLIDYDWPGNVRELAHVIERLVILGDGDEANEKHLPSAIVRGDRGAKAAAFDGEVITIRALQRKYAKWALDKMDGRKMLACEKLGIDPKTLSAWLSDDH